MEIFKENLIKTITITIRIKIIIIAGLRSVKRRQVPNLHIFSDSKLVVNWVTRKFEVWGAKIATYLMVAKPLLRGF